MSDPPTLDDLHSGHHSTRLKKFDYIQPACYFVTICSQNRKCIFGNVQKNQMFLNGLGAIVQECWLQIPTHFPWTTLRDFVVMPNHIHAIIQIGCQLGRSNAAPLQKGNAGPHVAPGSLGAIVRSFKGAVTKRIHGELGVSRQVWQRNYHEKLLRPGQEVANARMYISENPQKWQRDQENPESSS